MAKPVAKKDDKIVGVDTHFVLVPAPSGAVLTPMPMPFSGALSDGLAESVFVEGKPAAVAGSEATNQPEHVAPVGTFQRPPSNKAQVQAGSGSVYFDYKKAARDGDTATTCNDPKDAPNGVVVAGGEVIAGD